VILNFILHNVQTYTLLP